jgi:uncharacterized protein (DUF58 family)
MGVGNRIKTSPWELLLNVLVLVCALLLAVAGGVAHRSGQTHLAVTLSILSLGLAAAVTVTLAPRLLRRIQRDAGLFQTFRITRRGAFFIFLVVLIVVSTSLAGNNLLILILSFLLAALLVSTMASNVVLYGLKISLSLPEAIHAGQKAVLFLTLHNLKKRFSSFALVLKGRTELSEDDGEAADFFTQAKRFPYVRAAEALTVNVECEFRRRGIYPIHGFEVKTRFPFGFVARMRTIEVDGKIVVYPRLRDLRKLLYRYPFLRGREMDHRKGRGTGLYNIRDYRAGDDSRFIHWKASSKLSRPMVREFVEEEERPFCLLFSTYLPEQTERTRAQFEKGLSIVTSLACLYRRQGISFTFNSGEFEVAVNSRGEEFDLLMEYLAQVQPSSQRLLDASKVDQASVLFLGGKTLGVRGVPSLDYLRL